MFVFIQMKFSPGSSKLVFGVTLPSYTFTEKGQVNLCVDILYHPKLNYSISMSVMQYFHLYYS